MLTIISWILLIISLGIIAAIVIKKFPMLALIDTENIPGAKEAKFKDEMMRKRVERDLSKVGGVFGRFWLAVSGFFSRLLHGSHARLARAKDKYKKAVKLTLSERQQKIKDLMAASVEALKKEDYAAAEDQLVEVVSLDQKNLPAFFRLGDLYGRQKKYPEARETYKFALKLARQHRGEEADPEVALQEIYYSLAWLEKESGETAASLEYAQEALDLEPNCPRYLDLILDLSIMKKDVDLAGSTLEKLAAVNPENNKLSEWREAIAALKNE